MKKKTLALQAVFLALCIGSAVYYFIIGSSSKDYVAAFGMAEFAIALICVIMLAVNRRRIGGMTLLAYFVLGVMQLVPIIYAAAYIGGSFAAHHIAMHVVVLIPLALFYITYFTSRGTLK